MIVELEEIDVSFDLWHRAPHIRDGLWALACFVAVGCDRTERGVRGESLRHNWNNQE